MDINSSVGKLSNTYKRQKDITMENDIEDEEQIKFRITWTGYDDKQHSRVVPMLWSGRYMMLMRGMTRDSESIRVMEVDE
jgi:hypothetical protein